MSTSATGLLVGSGVHSPDVKPFGQYRYRLRRAWDLSLPCLGWILLNPSTADAVFDDPTVRRVRSFSEDAGYGSFELGNLFALRATNPRDLRRHFPPQAVREDLAAWAQVCGEENFAQLKAMASACTHLVAGWGQGAPSIVVNAVLDLFTREVGKDVLRLQPRPDRGGRVGDYPGHPLYLPGSRRPELWREPHDAIRIPPTLAPRARTP